MMESTFHNSTFPKDVIKEFSKRARTYTSYLDEVKESKGYIHPESSLFISSDETYQKDIKKKLTRFTKSKHVILVAIGGSLQGTHAVYKACADKNSPRLTIVDSIEDKYVEDTEHIFNHVKNPNDIALVVISKSGSTTETMLNAVNIISLGEKKFGPEFLKRVIFIGNEDTAFLEAGKKKKILCFTLPNIIGGRFSVFTAVGIVPLTLLGINTTALLKGAREAVSRESLESVEASSVDLALHAYSGIRIVNVFTFNKRLRACALWYRQLLAESIGKNQTKSSTPFTHQLLPVVSTSSDLHSTAQLYLGGYTGMYTHFIYYTELAHTRIPQSHWMLEHIPFLKSKRATAVKDIIAESVLHAYNDQMLPYRYTKLKKCSEQEIGYLLASFMAEVMYLGNLFNIDTFDQPSVEFYKKYVRAELN